MKPPALPNMQLLEHWFAALETSPRHIICHTSAAAWALKVALYKVRAQYKAIWQRQGKLQTFPLEALYITHDRKMQSNKLTISRNPVWDVIVEVNGVTTRSEFDKIDAGAERALCMELIRNAATSRRGVVSHHVPIDPNIAAATEVINAARIPRAVSVEERAIWRTEDHARRIERISAPVQTAMPVQAPPTPEPTPEEKKVQFQKAMLNPSNNILLLKFKGTRKPLSEAIVKKTLTGMGIPLDMVEPIITDLTTAERWFATGNAPDRQFTPISTEE